ncbi:MAG: 2-C-methyl-D-erythritol 4-phosphate cytidylyltransferase [Hoylesella shahii]|uniref:2-C-methyl-D-erythritol 4-phosphate cytidylyltransferase n=1 Tax=Hoylesella shahii TaxID=228603 RepID=UPI003F9F711D
MNYVVIVAGGKGLRMGGDVPKQFLLLGGKPVLMRTIERFHTFDAQLQIILVLPPDQQGYWHELCLAHHFKLPYLLADGGATRFESVRNGLALIPNDAQGVVAVHDGVRPMVSVKVIERCFAMACKTQAVIPVTPVVETLRQIMPDGASQTVNRDAYRLVQTPQTFDLQLLKQAYQQPYSTAFTDDASVVEALGMQITMVEGNKENIKITTPFDLDVCERLLHSTHSAAQ